MKIGDRVIVIKLAWEDEDTDLAVGDVGTIENITHNIDTCITVKFDKQLNEEAVNMTEDGSYVMYLDQLAVVRTYQEDFLERNPNFDVSYEGTPCECRDIAYCIKSKCWEKHCKDCWKEIM